ncbi:MAG: xanthine dehydrogenase accessory protein XdhC [Betaproteobacteria bacterium]|nr:xanthine dehydrogenase accessory protein XdhC [Betaproteobacteria bacterium]
MSDWLASLEGHVEAGGEAVRVVVAATRGSAPREAGACMLVSRESVEGTIGGGHLELRATGIARAMLSSSGVATRLDRFPLGATLGQCCGGAVALWFERFGGRDLAFLREASIFRASHREAHLVTVLEPGASPQRSLHPSSIEAPNDLVERLNPMRTPLWLFGAGHVGSALVRSLRDLSFDATWIDSREDAFRDALPPHVTPRHADSPELEVASAPADAFFLVMTHSHDLDYAIVKAILRRDDFSWAGLIGSETKARRFRQRLAAQGFATERIARLVSPIGIDGIESKLPGAIAISVAAQLQQALEARAASRSAPQRAEYG